MLHLLTQTDIPFMKTRRIAYVFSGTLILATIVWLVVHGGPRYSVDFTGGTLLQVRVTPPLHADVVRAALDAGGVRGVELQQMTGENAGEFLIRAKLERTQGDLFPLV